MLDLILFASIIGNALILLIAGIFISAGFSKIRPANQTYYVAIIEGYGLGINSLSDFIKTRLPRLIGALEIVIAVTLLLPPTQTSGLLLAALMLIVYLLGFIKQLLQGKADTDCGCAGPGTPLKISPLLILRNSILVALVVLTLNLPTQEISNATNFAAQQWLLILPLSIIMGLCYLCSEQLIASGQRLSALRQSTR